MFNPSDMADVRRINKQVGHHFFDKDEARFWGTKVESTLYKNMCFVTSEYNFDKTKRYYTIRQFNVHTGGIDTIGNFQGYTNLEATRKTARSYINR